MDRFLIIGCVPVVETRTQELREYKVSLDSVSLFKNSKNAEAFVVQTAPSAQQTPVEGSVSAPCLNDRRTLEYPIQFFSRNH